MFLVRFFVRLNARQYAARPNEGDGWRESKKWLNHWVHTNSRRNEWRWEREKIIKNKRRWTEDERTSKSRRPNEIVWS